jgi:hypothetical protein
MLLVLGGEHKAHLALFSSVPLEGADAMLPVLAHVLTSVLVCVAVAQEFARVGIEFLKTGANPKVYQSAARMSARAHP